MNSIQTRQKTLPVLIKEADDVFSKFIRIRDTQSDGSIRCFICGAKLRFAEAQNMHYIDRDQMPTRYSEINCNSGCEQCNCYDPQHKNKYQYRMVAVYGGDVVEELEAQSRCLQKYMRFELEELIEKVFIESQTAKSKEMKDRRPRKLKKVLKARKARKDALKTVQCSIATAMSVAQVARIRATPSDPISKTTAIIQVVRDSWLSVSKIMNQPPLNWRQA